MDYNPDNPKINIRFFFDFCNDLNEMRRFYTELVGLKEVSFRDDGENSWLVYQCEGFQIMWFKSGKRIEPRNEWAIQPGYTGGKLEVRSFSIEVPEKKFSEIVGKLISAKVKTLADAPQWRQDSYWGYSVMDPMGNTVEIYTIPENED